MNKMALNDIRYALEKQALDSLIVTSVVNVRYLTGFTGDSSVVIVTPDRVLFITNSLYYEEALDTIPDPYEVLDAGAGLFAYLEEQGKDLFGKTAGYEPENMTCASHIKWQDALDGVTLTPAYRIIEQLREIKTPKEIDYIKQAQAITDKTFNDILDLIRPGVSERDLALEIDYRFRLAGADKSAFPTIVAAGSHASKPHAVPSDRKLSSGDCVIFDMGASWNGYASDMTRTVMLGTADNRYREVYESVLDAQQAGLDAIRAGLRGGEADASARSVIENKGYGERFIHSLGHAVGLDIHEFPSLSRNSETVLKSGMVVTVEPGIYIPGWGGVRIEDMVVVTDDGCDNLTGTPKTLIEL